MSNVQVQYDQSLCGPVAPFPAAAAGTALSACGSHGAGTYHLTQSISIGGDPTQTCLTFTSGPVVLDLAGFTVTGRVLGVAISMHGTHVYSSASGGAITCSDSSGTNPGCLVLDNATDAATAVLEVDHFTLTNTNSTGCGPRNLYIDWNPSSNSFGNTTPIVLVHNIASTAGTCLTSNRIYNFAIQVKGDGAAYDNSVTCLSNAAACQGIVIAGSGGPGATDAQIYNNDIEMQLLNSGITTDTGRAMNCDGEGDSTPVRGCQMFNNYVDAHDSRAMRLRNVAATNDTVVAHDNLFDNATNGSTSFYTALIHWCDPDSGSDDGTGYDFYNNTINITAGAVLIMARNCANFPKFENNTVNGTSWSGRAGWVRVNAGGSGATLEMLDNPGINTSASPQSTTESTAGLKICNTGTGGGSGTVTAVNCLGPGLWNFGSVAVGGSSSSQTITVFNPTGSAMTSLSLVVGGTNPVDFPLVTNGCGATLSAGTNCTASYKLSPTAIGSRSATLTVTYAGGDGIGTQTASLSGTGTGVTPSAPGNPLITRRGVSPAAHGSFRSSAIALLVSTLEVAP